VQITADAATFVLVNFERVHPLRALLAGRLKCRDNPLLGLKFVSLMAKL
jgi:hypothetical protein